LLKPTLLLILFAKPFAKHGPPTAEIFAFLIFFSFKILFNFSAKVSKLLFITANPLVNKSMLVVSL
jgi:hypothetical protein